MPWCEGIVPDIDGCDVVDGEGQLSQGHVEFVHHSQVLPGFSVALGPGPAFRPVVVACKYKPLSLLHTYKQIVKRLIFLTLPSAFGIFLLSCILGCDRSTVLWQKLVRQFALFVTDGSYNVFGFLGHLVCNANNELHTRITGLNSLSTSYQEIS